MGREGYARRRHEGATGVKRARARKKYGVELTAEERGRLEQLQQKGTSTARKLPWARILLKAEEGLEDEAIAEAVGTSGATIERRRQRCVERTLAALKELPRPGGPPKLSGKQEAQRIAVACTPAPHGRARWTVELWAAQAGEVGFTDSLAREPVGQVLKKPPSSRGCTSSGGYRR
jgi:transposase